MWNEDKSTLKVVEELSLRCADGDGEAYKKLLELLKDKGLFCPAVKSYIDGIAMNRSKNLAQHFLMFIAPRAQYVDSVIGPFKQPDPEAVRGEILIGKSALGCPIFINEDECHYLVSGQTASGKSFFLYNIILQVLLRGDGNGY